MAFGYNEVPFEEYTVLFSSYNDHLSQNAFSVLSICSTEMMKSISVLSETIALSSSFPLSKLTFFSSKSNGLAN